MLRYSLYLLLYYIIRLRRNIARKNIAYLLQDHFKDQPKRLHEIEKKHFFFLIEEMFWHIQVFFNCHSLSNVETKNPELLEHYYQRKQPVIIMFGHYGYMINFLETAQQMSQQAVATYKTIKSNFWNKVVKRVRAKSNVTLIPNKDIIKYMLASTRKDVGYFIIFDQRPTKNQSQCKVNFFDKEVAFLLGAEKIARRLNYPVLYAYTSFDAKTNKHTLEYKKLTDDPTSHQLGAITQMAAFELEQQIRNQPEYWLWIHQRFKGSIQYL